MRKSSRPFRWSLRCCNVAISISVSVLFMSSPFCQPIKALLRLQQSYVCALTKATRNVRSCGQCPDATVCTVLASFALAPIYCGSTAGTLHQGRTQPTTLSLGFLLIARYHLQCSITSACWKMKMSGSTSRERLSIKFQIILREKSCLSPPPKQLPAAVWVVVLLHIRDRVLSW